MRPDPGQSGTGIEKSLQDGNSPVREIPGS
jgi:hypothetical protein